MLIDSNLPNNFWADVINKVKYLQNWLPTSYASDKKLAIILEKR